MTNNLRPGPDLLQTMPTLVLNVDHVMILFVCVPGYVRSGYSGQEKFFSGVMIVFETHNFYNGRETFYEQMKSYIQSIVCVCVVFVLSTHFGEGLCM